MAKHHDNRVWSCNDYEDGLRSTYVANTLFSLESDLIACNCEMCNVIRHAELQLFKVGLYLLVVWMKTFASYDNVEEICLQIILVLNCKETLSLHSELDI